jgi:hypothetical protein
VGESSTSHTYGSDTPVPAMVQANCDAMNLCGYHRLNIRYGIAISE